MKNFALIFLFALACTFSLTAQEDRYKAAMTPIVNAINSADSSTDWQDLNNRLERIAQAETEEWLPNYYLSFVALQQALVAMQSGQADQVKSHVERAEGYYQKAFAVSGENSEIKCLEGYVYQGYLWIDPMNNGPTYSPKAQAAYAAASAMDPTNPRPQLLAGMLTLFTPDFFGGGAANALPALQSAQALFQTEVQTERMLLPSWGMGTSTYLLQKAEQDLAAKG